MCAVKAPRSYDMASPGELTERRVLPQGTALAFDMIYYMIYDMILERCVLPSRHVVPLRDLSAAAVARCQLYQPESPEE